MALNSLFCADVPLSNYSLTYSSPTPAQEDCIRLTHVRFSSVGSGPTSATEPSVQLDLEAGTICWWISDSRTYHTAVLGIRCGCYYLVSETKAQW